MVSCEPEGRRLSLSVLARVGRGVGSGDGVRDLAEIEDTLCGRIDKNLVGQQIHFAACQRIEDDPPIVDRCD